MGLVDQALAAAIAGARPRLEPEPARPESIDEAARYFGGHANRDIAEHYGVSIRTVQRWRTFERGDSRQARRPPADLRRSIITLARRRQLTAWRAENSRRLRAFDPAGRIRRHGLDMRLRGWIIVSRPPARVHTMPAEPGPPQWVSPELVGPTMDAWDAGDAELAALLLTGAFFVAYGLPGVEVTTIDACRIGLR